MHFNATCFIVFSAVLPCRCDWQHTQELYLALNRFLRVSLEVNIAALCLLSRPLFIRMGRAKGAPLRAYLRAEMEGCTWIWWGARCLPIVLRWLYPQGSFIAWLLRLVLSIGVGKGCSKWADGSGLQMFALGREWDESSGALMSSWCLRDVGSVCSLQWVAWSGGSLCWWFVDQQQGEPLGGRGCSASVMTVYGFML